MNRLPASVVAFALAVSSWNCTPPNNPPANCVYTIQLAQHPGPFRGAGVPAGGGDYSGDVLVNASTWSVLTSASGPWITIAPGVPRRGLGYRSPPDRHTAAG